jgi:hypothetical protein
MGNESSSSRGRGVSRHFPTVKSFRRNRQRSASGGHNYIAGNTKP